jgi:Fasciclin domain
MKKIKYNLLIALSGMAILSSCNKELEQLPAIATPVYPTGNGVAAAIAANPNDSLFARLIVRSGLTATLNDLTKSFTIFAVDNAGMKVFVNAASGGLVPLNAPDATFSAFIANTLPAASAAGIVQYLTVGQKLPSASIGTSFPNFPYTSQIVLDPTQPFVRMPLFPVKGTPYSYLNNLPITGVDQTAANGVIHHVFTVAAPPTATLKTMLAGESTLSYFRAAVARADSGSVGLSRFDSLLNYGVTNMTVLAPNDNAFRTLVFGLAFQGYLATRPQPYTATDSAIATATGNGAVAAGPAFLSTNNVTTAQVKGIVAYHLLASLTSSTTTPYQPNIRVFSVNIPATPTFVKTLVNGSVAAHPGISARATYTGPSATAATFTGLGTFPSGGAPYSGTAANAIVIDKHAVNGVYHIIDRVLLPQ